MKNPNLKNILDEMLKILNPRVRSVVEKRFGLKSEAYQTLENIGQNLGITRERVRQIEALGLKQLSNKNVLEPLGAAFAVIENYFKEYGGVRREDHALKELAGEFSLNEKNKENVINFVLNLGKDKAVYFKETPSCQAAWALSDSAYNNAVNLVETLRQKIESANSPFSKEEVLKTLASLSKENNNKALFSYVELSYKLAQNPFGQWGPVHSPEISPKGVKDKAFLVFKKEKKPLHFNEVAELINKLVFSDRKAHPQTVHNELIKDPRFVLVGRGTYALADWGYEPGTVRDVLVSVLKSSPGGLTKNEIIKTVQSKRLVKENTILLNLQNKKFFKKAENERFILS
ncbi:hypothetical protein A2567_00295 [Candidatus Azambacteria bacterium RIFOXYD1_FULL_42_11]|uniref:HTH HARE-type domain-containing protein n=3 Tax=Candidatus Azamiibacteriota TaxID=1752741 RepID=A0A1F5CJN6_9BACT|nr:MAG: RNA polymerase sigma factor [Candidatus Azambacteria bacterium GW2011_GWB1_42_17]KKS76154.1 MAG: RNA polymerase sigma factor [Candidatus Azambacteria bacterium GW2011_GWA2_42_9]KKS88214.1 MAG: RNA polymerase sigma factor [Parcubacteria group bacterium GW2011_GWC1_43_11]OGD43064.1 MAG: hypothetical protein A2567_00295 [Candidatus Azambacteria bacterium RIFOXYD1_FULL_42_11]